MCPEPCSETISSNPELKLLVKKRARELEQTTNRIQSIQERLARTERQASVGRLAASVTHELKAPLNSLSIHFQIIRQQLIELEGQNNSSFSETLSIIDSEISRMNRLLGEFVAYARFPEPKFRRTDINSLVEQVAKFLAPEAAEARVTISIDLYPNLPCLAADEDQIREVLTNLYMNAFQAMSRGGTVALSTHRANGVGGRGPGVMIRVADEGEGIPSEALENIFEPFYSTKKKGLGLGLAISFGIVNGHGGTIEVESIEGVGSTFTVWLPSNCIIKSLAFGSINL
jgi:signal transduction histidine kinase